MGVVRRTCLHARLVNNGWLLVVDTQTFDLRPVKKHISTQSSGILKLCPLKRMPYYFHFLEIALRNHPYILTDY